MPKTTTLLIVAGAAVALYLITAKASPLKLSGKTTGTSTANYIAATGTAATGLSNLWDSIFNSGDSSSESG
jgi:hypothetical protein